MLLAILLVVPRVLGGFNVRRDTSISENYNAEPFETNYVHKTYIEEPEYFTPFDTLSVGNFEDDSVEAFDNGHGKYLSSYTQPNINFAKLMSKSKMSSSPSTNSAVADSATNDLRYKPLDYFLSPSDINSDYESFRTERHNPASSMHDFYHTSDNAGKNTPDNVHLRWPYYNHNPYAYEQMKIDAEIEKAKDKRYGVDAARIIPIHEDLADDIPNSYEPLLTTTERQYVVIKDTSTDNPMNGNDPFFSFTLNDYFSDNTYDDHLTFKGLDWARDIDRRPLVEQVDYSGDSGMYHNIYKKEAIDKGTESKKNTEKRQDLNENEQGKFVIEKDKTKQAANGHKEIKFKDFVDAFANRFDAEDKKKGSKYVMKHNRDKGENRKGFRRVYQKNEYQEDNEFYDNNNSSAQAEDIGSSKSHIGGSDGILKSFASAQHGDQANAFGTSNYKANENYKNNRNGHLENKTVDGQFNLYKDVAKKVAQSNEADYVVQ